MICMKNKVERPFTSKAEPNSDIVTGIETS